MSALRRGSVWCADELVGALRVRDDGHLLFTYDSAWLDHGFAISISVPLSHADAEVDAHAYFEGLLPEGRARQRICKQLKLDDDDDASLLFAIGRDCAGALVVLADDEQPAPERAPREPLTDEELQMVVSSRGAAVPATFGRRRFSLAGAQDKLAVIVEDGRLWLPSARDPSSHILKFETVPWVCFTETMGAELAARAGLVVAQAEYAIAKTEPAMPYLLLERYDREGEHAARVRLHQEDIAQALGYTAGEKYEADGGPSLGQVADLLRAHVADPIVDVTRLRDWQIFSYLIGNSDAHAKNLSLLHDRETGVPALAPFYDLVCIEFHNRIGSASFDRTMAFLVGERAEPEEIRRADWEMLAKQMRVSPRGMLKRLGELCEALPTHATESRQAFARKYGDNQVYDRYVETISDRCRWVQHNVLSRR